MATFTWRCANCGTVIQANSLFEHGKLIAAHFEKDC